MSNVNGAPRWASPSRVAVLAAACLVTALLGLLILWGAVLEARSHPIEGLGVLSGWMVSVWVSAAAVAGTVVVLRLCDALGGRARRNGIAVGVTVLIISAVVLDVCVAGLWLMSIPV